MRKMIGIVPVMGAFLAIGCQSVHPQLQSLPQLQPQTKDSSRCVHIYSATSWRVHQVIPGGLLSHIPGGFFSDKAYDKEDNSDTRTGTGIAVISGGHRFLITAAHVVGPAWVDGVAIAQKWQGRTALTGGSVRIRASSLSYAPLRLLVDQVSDIAVMEMSADFWQKLDVMSFQPGTDLPALEEVVKVWGFPQTTSPQLKIGPQVVAANVEMLELNEPLDGGYSGGPVLDQTDHLIGMVLRSTQRQSRAVPSAKIVQALANFEKNAVPYRDPMEILR